MAENKISGLRTALDLTEQWDALDNGSALLTGVIVARREVVEQNSAAVDAFLKATPEAWSGSTPTPPTPRS